MDRSLSRYPRSQRPPGVDPYRPQGSASYRPDTGRLTERSWSARLDVHPVPWAFLHRPLVLNYMYYFKNFISKEEINLEKETLYLDFTFM